MVALAVILVLVTLAILAPISPDPARQSWTAVRKAPSALNWFGEVGRDILTRILYGRALRSRPG